MHDHEKEPIGHALHVLDTTMRRYIDTYSHKKEHENLTGTNTWVIQFIADHKDGPVYLRDIERRFGITRSTASKVVDMLVRNGFVERHTGETDARLRRLTLTEKVRKPFGRYPRRPRSNGSRFNERLHAK